MADSMSIKLILMCDICEMALYIAKDCQHFKAASHTGDRTLVMVQTVTMVTMAFALTVYLSDFNND